jgi:hypothetical protein
MVFRGGGQSSDSAEFKDSITARIQCFGFDRNYNSDSRSCSSKDLITEAKLQFVAEGADRICSRSGSDAFLVSDKRVDRSSYNSDSRSCSSKDSITEAKLQFVAEGADRICSRSGSDAFLVSEKRVDHSSSDKRRISDHTLKEGYRSSFFKFT